MISGETFDKKYNVMLIVAKDVLLFKTCGDFILRTIIEQPKQSGFGRKRDLSERSIKIQTGMIRHT